ncbi:MAG: hypothetical protein J7K90_09450, partial [Desulfuromusa sp.]|nr:hypothetical protein [Desulfuromusa sp.]
KENLFSNLDRQKTTLTRMTVDGDREGDCYLLNPISSAAFLGGTLIMLPDDVIEEGMQSEKLDGEMEDAFGEVANIIAGVFTQAFVDKYAKKLRFIKKTVEELIPTKIDFASDEPFPPGNYFVANCQMKVGDKDLGCLEFVVPAVIFELEEDVAETITEQQPEETTPEQESAPKEEAATDTAESPPETESAPPAEKKVPFADAKKLADVVFNATIGQVGEEIGALLGQSLTCDDIQLMMTSKADFFSNHCMEKSVLTHMKVTGDREGLGFMAIQVPDAIILGGTLIMLPEDQIQEQKKNGQFDGDVEDAYGEIANILSGSLTQVFLDRYPKQLRFIKTEAETIVPTKIDPDSDQPFAEENYYLASFAIHLEGHELHRILLIFPAAIFGLDNEPMVNAPQGQSALSSEKNTNTTAASSASETNQPAPGEWGGPPDTTENVSQATPGSSSESAIKGGTTQATSAAQTLPEPTGAPLILLMTDQKVDADPFVEILSSAQYECQVLSFQEEVKALFQQHKILGIFLIMAEVGEKGFAAAIKLQAAGRPLPPIIFAGSEWTRSAVLRAIKYGAKDILVMPASGDEIQDKINRHIKKAS